jgi:AraC-like DNA-binding protein
MDRCYRSAVAQRRLALSDRPNDAGERTTDVLAELLDTLRLSTVVYGRFELGAPWGFQIPDVDAAHMIVVGRGSVRLEVAGVGAPLVLSAGDLALLPHGGAHALRDSRGRALHVLGDRECQRIRRAEPLQLGGPGARTSLVVAAFWFRSAHRSLSIQRLARVIHIPAGDPAVPSGLASTARLFITESASCGAGATVVMNRLADVLLVQTVREFIAGTACGQHGLRALADRPIGTALAAIHDRPAEPWTVERLAARAALSRSGFAARFTALVGEPPLAYLARWRMTRAAQLLRDTDLVMSEVAERVGYRSEASFNKAFKRLEGITPGVYRQRRERPGSAYLASGSRRTLQVRR